MPFKKTIPAAALSLAIFSLLSPEPCHAAPLPFKKSLQDLTAGKLPIESFQATIIGCRSSLGFHLQVWGEGTGILNQEKQIAVSKDQLKAQLDLLAKAGFADLPNDYGAPGSKPATKSKDGKKPATKATPKGAAALEVLCSIEVRAGEAQKMVTQFNKGALHEPFMALGRDLVETVRESAGSAKSVKNLPEGLEGIDKGGLSKHTFLFLMNRVVEVRTPGSDAAGWLLRIDGDQVSVSERTFSKGEGKVLKMKLDQKAFSSVLQAIRQSQPDQFPPNLYEEVYTDLTIKVLNRSINVNARQFAGMNPKTHLDKQERFDKLVREIETLARTALKEGKPAS